MIFTSFQKKSDILDYRIYQILDNTVSNALSVLKIVDIHLHLVPNYQKFGNPIFHNYHIRQCNCQGHQLEEVSDYKKVVRVSLLLKRLKSNSVNFQIFVFGKIARIVLLNCLLTIFMRLPAEFTFAIVVWVGDVLTIPL